MANQVFLARAPVRVDPAGGGSDTPPFCLEHHGAVVNFAVAQYVHARLEPQADSKRVTFLSEDFDACVECEALEQVHLDGPLDLLKGVAMRMAPTWGFTLTVHSQVPAGSGLGASGAVGVACVGAFLEAVGRRHSPMEIAALASDIERSDLGIAGGSQDSYGAALGGVNLLSYSPGGGISHRSLNLPDAVLLELERRCVLIDTGEAHLSGSIHDDILAGYRAPDSPVVDAMQNMARIAGEVAQALESGNLELFGEKLSENWHHYQRLHPSCNTDTLRSFYAAAQPHVVGGKTCGAAGGGAVLFLAKEGERGALERACAELGGRSIPFAVSRSGLACWSVG